MHPESKLRSCMACSTASSRLRLYRSSLQSPLTQSSAGHRVSHWSRPWTCWKGRIAFDSLSILHESQYRVALCISQTTQSRHSRVAPRISCCRPVLHRCSTASILCKAANTSRFSEPWPSPEAMASPTINERDELDQVPEEDNRVAKRARLSEPAPIQEQVVKVTGFGNRALRSVLKGSLRSLLVLVVLCIDFVRIS